MRIPKLLNLWKIASQLGPVELVLFALYKLGLRLGVYKIGQRVQPALASTATDHQLPIPNSRPIFTLPAREDLLVSLGPDGKAALFREADEIISGQARLFGGEPVPLKLGFDLPLRHWTAYETNPRFLSPFLSPPSGEIPVPDIKYLWEPARFGFAFILGRAYRLAGDEKYAEAFWKYFEEFEAENPPDLGPHWMNGQEAALRLMAFVWAAHVFGSSSATTSPRRLHLRQSIAHHALRITKTLLYARSQNNNHLLTEAAALYTAGLYLGNPKFRNTGWRWFHWAVQHQIGGYGEYIQHSTNYHRVMLQAALWVNLIRSADFGPQKDWPLATAQSLSRAAHWLFSMLDAASGGVPNLGSNDGALILPLTTCSFSDFRPVVQAAARAFLNTQISSGPWDELSAWLGLAPVQKTYAPGHYMTDNLRGRDSWAYLRASRFRSRLSHMDQLHLDLWWRGLNLARDAGTYLYNADPPWDNPLTATRVHNTVMVNGRDQMTRGGRFITLDWFPAYSRTSFEADESILQRVHAYHKGYRRLGVRHERTVTVHADGHWRVEDALVTRRPAPRVFRLHWLLPDWEWQLEENPQEVDLKLKSPFGWVQMRISGPAPAARHASLVRSGELLHGPRDALPFEGWSSPTYGTKLPALSLAVEVQSDRDVRFVSEFHFPT